MRSLPARLLPACLALSALPAAGAVFDVSNNNDAGPGSLRAAIEALNAHPDPNDQHDILFRLPVGQETVVLSSALPVIEQPFVRLLGQPVLNPGAPPTLRAINRFPLLQLGASVQEAEVSALTLSQGLPCVDADALQPGADLLLDRLRLLGCGGDLSAGADQRGGALRLRGDVVISHSAFEGNFLSLDSAPGALLGADIALLAGSLDLTDSHSVGARLIHSAGDPTVVCFGGSLYAEVNTTVRVLRSEISDAIVECGLNSGGGAMASEGRLSLDRVRLRQNIARAGGAVWFGPNTSATAVLRIQNSLFLDNQAWDYLSPFPEGVGGGLFVRSNLNGPSQVEMRNVSFALNRARGGVGAHLADSGANYLQLHSTLFGQTGNADNGSPGSACDLDVTSVLPTTPSRSLAVDDSCAALAGLQQVDPALLGLIIEQPANAPPLDVHLADGSPAIDAGVPGTPSASDFSACAAQDLDGRTRPLDGDGDGVAACDIGAQESQGERIFAGGFED